VDRGAAYFEIQAIIVYMRPCMGRFFFTRASWPPLFLWKNACKQPRGAFSLIDRGWLPNYVVRGDLTRYCAWLAQWGKLSHLLLSRLLVLLRLCWFPFSMNNYYA